MANSGSTFDDSLQRAQRPVLGYLIRRTGSLHVAQDILQSANVTAIAKQDSFVPDTNFVAWLRQIAVNHHQNHIRKQAAAGVVALIDEQLHSVIERRRRDRIAQEQQQTDWQKLSGCIQQLPDQQQHIVRSFYLNGDSLNDLAKTTGRTANAVGQILYRARLALLQCVRKPQGDLSSETAAVEKHSQQGAKIR